MMNNFRYIIIVSFFTFYSCSNIESKTNFSSDKFNKGIEVFDEKLTDSLFLILASNFDISFNKTHLNSLLLDINISKLKSGEKVLKELIFEDFKCSCVDRMEISYSKENRFILFIYEEFYEKDLDFCPESTYQYSFLIVNNRITDLKLDFMAG